MAKGGMLAPLLEKGVWPCWEVLERFRDIGTAAGADCCEQPLVNSEAWEEWVCVMLIEWPGTGRPRQGSHTEGRAWADDVP